MANWKKMAEAFGRAVHNRERLTEHAPRTQKGFDKATAKDAIEDERFRRSAADAGAEEEFRRGFNDEELLPDRDNDRVGGIVSNRGDVVEPKDFAAAEREQGEFDKAFDDAVNEATARHSGGTSESETERMRADIRRQAIEMLKDEKYDISDVLDYLQPYRIEEQ